jgi:RNase H-fold protein (predicted Holliday junction resolvase)
MKFGVLVRQQADELVKKNILKKYIKEYYPLLNKLIVGLKNRKANRRHPPYRLSHKNCNKIN